MALEQSKAAKRRYHDGAIHNRYFVGDGIDIGGKPNPLGQYAGVFPRLLSCRTWDLKDGDGQFMRGVPCGQFDFVHSSHCLEHLHDPLEALGYWVRIVKKGGFAIVTVPDEDLYEQGVWPSRFNPDHKWTFTIHKQSSWSPRSINNLDLVTGLAGLAAAERIVQHRDFLHEALAERQLDQTLTPVAECSIEFILRRL